MSQEQAIQGQYIDLAELTGRLPLSRRSVRRYVTDAAYPMPAFRVGGKLIFHWPSVVSWLENHRVHPLDVGGMTNDLMNSLEYKNGKSKD
ncbi:MAG: hypothetical protein AAGF10_00125 [Verrucomicrobiota bacterium]